MNIGQKIRIAREQKEMTLDDVAKLCGTRRQTIYKYENGLITNIPYDKIIALSDALNVTPSYLFGWDERSSPDEPTLTEGEKLMLELFRRIPEDRQSAALDLLRAALKMQ